MCKHEKTKTWSWMGRVETVCTDCWTVTWHEDKPMTLTLDNRVLVTFSDEEGVSI